MNSATTEEKSYKRKYLVPLVILLLCGMALTSVAYAYSSEIKDDTTIASETDTDLALSFAANGNGKIYFDKSVDAIGSTTTYKYKVNATDSANAIKVTITSKMAVADIKTPTVTVYSDSDFKTAATGVTATPSDIAEDKTFTISFTGEEITSAPLATYYVVVSVNGTIAATAVSA